MNRRVLLGTGAATLAAASTGVAQDGYSYKRPNVQKGSRCLFLGDSITDMKWGRNEKDRNHYLGHSYVYLIASRLGVDMPEAELEFFNRGISGNKVSDLKARWERDAIEMKPDLLSILVGVNDVGRSAKGVDPKTWEEDYRFILEQSRAANPELRLVLLDPFVLRSGRFLNNQEKWDDWRRQTDLLREIVDDWRSNMMPFTF